MKTKCLLLVCFCLINFLQSWAYDFKEDGIYYNYIQGTDNEVEVTYKDDNYDSYNNIVNVLIPNTVSYNDISYNVTRIGAKAFYYPTTNSSVNSPCTIDFYDNVTTIGDSAFWGCANLVRVSNYNFKLDNIQTIGKYAFVNCSKLQSIKIPNSVISIGDYAYENCNGASEIIVGWDVPLLINASVFEGVPNTCKLLIPSGTYRSYSDKEIWKDFKIIDNDLYGYCPNIMDEQDYIDHNDSIMIYSNTTWKASSSADWITIIAASGQGNDYCKFNIASNKHFSYRYAEIIFSGEGIENWKIQVSQRSAPVSSWEYVRSIQNDDWVASNNWMNKVYAQGNNMVYIVGEKGFIAKSADNALTWNKQYFPNQETLNDIIFCNDAFGFIVGNNGTILKTEDAGTNWMQLNSGTIQHINAIAAVNENNIWAVGNGGLIMQSTDMGETWIVKNYANNRNLYDIKFHENIGYIVGDRNNILKTTNGGVYWETQLAYNNPNEYDKIYSLSITENKAFALLNRGAIISAAHDSSWYFIDGDEHAFNGRTGVYFQNDSCGYVESFDYTTCGCGFGLWINQTIDSGKTWEEVTFSNSLFHLLYYVGVSDKSNFSFSEDNKFGYFLSGQLLLRTPYTGEFYVGLNNVKSENSNLIVKQQGNNLQISSLSKTIAGVEITSVAGIKLFQENRQVNEVNANISSLPKGIYLIRALFTDKMSETVKWIKQ